MIETERLLLRAWEDRDRAPYHAIKADPAVMATLGPVQARAESDETLDRLIALEQRHGHTFWAMERRADRALIGYCGLVHAPAGSPVASVPEIGWGLGGAHWGRGYATEAARAVLAWAWANTAARRVVAITSRGNARSRAVMERLGMRRLADGDFGHPALAEGDPLRPHVAYAVDRPAQGVGSAAPIASISVAWRADSASARARSASSAG